MSDDPQSPLVQAQIERALAPYVGKVPAVVLEEMREQLEDLLTTHPVVSRWVERLGPSPRVLTSAVGTSAGAASPESLEHKPNKARR